MSYEQVAVLARIMWFGLNTKRERASKLWKEELVRVEDFSEGKGVIGLL